MEETIGKSKRMRVGWLVFAGLAVLTAVEFWLSVVVRPATPYLVATSAVKAALIIHYFMHVSQLWRQGSDHK